MRQESDELNIWQEREDATFKKWASRIFRSWPLFLLSLFFCLSVAYLYLRYTSPVYKAVASLIVKDEKKGEDLMDNSIFNEMGLGGSSNKLVENEIEKLKSYDLMEAVVDTLHLFVSVKQAGRIKDVPVFNDELPFVIEVINPEAINKTIHCTIVKKGGAIFFRGKNDKHAILIRYGQTLNCGGVIFRCVPGAGLVNLPPTEATDSIKYRIDINSLSETTIQYSGKLSVEPASKVATVINLTMKDRNEEKATSILQALIAIYNKQGLEDKNRISENTIAFLNDRIASVRSEMQGEESSVERFKNKNKLTDLSSDAQQYLESSQQVDAQKAQAETKLNIISALEKNLQVAQDNPQVVPSTLGLEDPTLEKLIEKHNELALQKAKLKEKVGANHPMMIDLDNQIVETRGRLLASVRNLKQAYRISLDDVSKKDAQLNGLIHNVPQMEKSLVQITRNKNVQEQLYSFLLQKSEEASVVRASNIESSRTILKARSLGKVSPKAQLVWLFSILMGMVIPVAIIGAKDFMGNTVGDISQVKQHTSLPLLGVISHVKKLKSSVVLHSRSRSVVSEQIRSIRSSINHLGNGKNVKTIMVTSFQSGDGKSFVSLNLAAGYALLGKKIVMLEFDLRRPHIARDLGLDTEKGIADVLSGQSSIDDVLVEIKDYKGCLFVVPAGNLTSNPAELISGPGTPHLMGTLLERFDHIIINTPPISVVTDASLLQQYADVTLVVLRQDHTSREIYSALKHRTDAYPANPIYLLLNDVGKRRRYRGGFGLGGYEYGYGNGSKGYYYAEK